MCPSNLLVLIFQNIFQQIAKSAVVGFLKVGISVFPMGPVYAGFESDLIAYEFRARGLLLDLLAVEKEDRMPVGAAFLGTVFASYDVADGVTGFAEAFEKFLHVRVDESSRMGGVLSIGKGYGKGLLGGLLFGNAAPYEAVNFVFLALPAFATRNLSDICEVNWIEAHGFPFG